MFNTNKRIVLMFIALSLILTLFVSSNLYSAEPGKEIRNVILLIPDGCNSNVVTLARWFNDNRPLVADEILTGMAKTYWAGGPVTDSAPAGTAMATGYKVSDGTIGVYPKERTMPGLEPVKPEDVFKPIASVLEGAKLNGLSTGLVATINAQHATPASFSAHWSNRNDFEKIGEQQVYQDMDVVLASGSDYLRGALRADREDLLQVLIDRGYDLVSTPDGMRNSNSNKLWGLFGNKTMAFDIDRDPAKEPSLAEMTDKALGILSKNHNGFFLMVEGSQVDIACHNNDPVAAVKDYLAFNQAVQKALEFAKADGHTVVIVATDHETGGMTIGSRNVADSTKEALSVIMDPLRKVKISGDALMGKLNADRSNIREAVAEFIGITDLTDAEVLKIKSATKEMGKVIGPMVSIRSDIGWTTGVHCGGDVPLYSYHPTKNARLSGLIENTDIAKYIAEMLDFDLDTVNKVLFVRAEEAFQAKGATTVLDKTDPANPVFVVTKGANVLKLAIDKDVAILNGVVINLNGLTLATAAGKVFVPSQAVSLIP